MLRYHGCRIPVEVSEKQMELLSKYMNNEHEEESNGLTNLLHMLSIGLPTKLPLMINSRGQVKE